MPTVRTQFTAAIYLLLFSLGFLVNELIMLMGGR